MTDISESSENNSQFKVTPYPIWREKWLSTLTPNPEFSSLVPSVINYIDILGIQTVIEQSEFIDKDYSEAYTRFYSHAFRPPPKTCDRYIFFKQPFLSVNEIRNYKIANSFQGFITVWPTCPKVIGGSVLPFLPSTAIAVDTCLIG